jgi:hypothetical protein
MPDITLITPTGDRPEAFALCEKYMRRQTTNLDIQWIVIDDGADVTNCTMGQEIYRLPPIIGEHTLGRNILYALPHVRGDCILFIEDDDWYRADYIDVMASKLKEGYDCVGEGKAKYYNVRCNGYDVYKNSTHASLCQTGMHVAAIEKLLLAIEREKRWIDLHLWKQIKNSHIFFDYGLCVGIKGMPGRKGIGQGHVEKFSNIDKDYAILKQWIGEDYLDYINLSTIKSDDMEL